MKIIVIGGVAAVPKAAVRARRRDPNAEITIIENIVRNKMDGLARSLTPIEVKAKIDKGKDFIMLDIRTPSELEKSRINDPRVKHIPLGALRSRIAELPKDKEIITFCAISQRGYEAQRILDGYGFTNVKFMDGGIATWIY